jgi:hypothetical protein
MGKLGRSSGQPDYNIGKGKPPHHTRWKRGTSGNPGGKRKGTLNLETTFQEALIRPVTVTMDGKKKIISALDALVMRILDAGIKGDIKAINPRPD